MVTLGYGPRTIWHDCTLVVWSNNSQDSLGLYGPGPVRTSYGPRTEIFNVFHILRHPCGTRKGPVRQPYGHVRELTQPELAKLPHGHRIWPYVARMDPLRAPQGLFTGCLRCLNPYGVRKLIMHALKLYGSRTGRQNSYGSARGVDVRFLFKTAREQPVRGPGSVMWLRHKVCLILQALW